MAASVGMRDQPELGVGAPRSRMRDARAAREQRANKEPRKPDQRAGVSSVLGFAPSA